MASINMKCASNTYAGVDSGVPKDLVFEQDTDFYLNSISAAQQFYIAILDMRLGWIGWVIPFGIAGWLRWACYTLFAAVTLVLQLDTAKIKRGETELSTDTAASS